MIATENEGRLQLTFQSTDKYHQVLIFHSGICHGRFWWKITENYINADYTAQDILESPAHTSTWSRVTGTERGPWLRRTCSQPGWISSRRSDNYIVKWYSRSAGSEWISWAVFN